MGYHGNKAQAAIDVAESALTTWLDAYETAVARATRFDLEVQHAINVAADIDEVDQPEMYQHAVREAAAAHALAAMMHDSVNQTAAHATRALDEVLAARRARGIVTGRNWQ